MEGRQRDRRQSGKEAARLQLHTRDGCQDILTWIQGHASQVDLKRIAQLDDQIRNRQRHLAAVAKIKASRKRSQMQIQERDAREQHRTLRTEGDCSHNRCGLGGRIKILEAAQADRDGIEVQQTCENIDRTGAAPCQTSQSEAILAKHQVLHRERSESGELGRAQRGKADGSQDLLARSQNNVCAASGEQQGISDLQLKSGQPHTQLSCHTRAVEIGEIERRGGRSEAGGDEASVREQFHAGEGEGNRPLQRKRCGTRAESNGEIRDLELGARGRDELTKARARAESRGHGEGIEAESIFPNLQVGQARGWQSLNERRGCHRSLNLRQHLIVRTIRVIGQCHT